jgi:hypothetical protein
MYIKPIVVERVFINVPSQGKRLLFLNSLTMRARKLPNKTTIHRLVNKISGYKIVVQALCVHSVI